LTLAAIRAARERGVPCFGTCGGFQHMVLEYARTVLGFRDAQHAEYDPYASRLFVTALACSLAGRQMPLTLAAGLRVAAIYGALARSEERRVGKEGKAWGRAELVKKKKDRARGSTLLLSN